MLNFIVNGADRTLRKSTVLILFTLLLNRDIQYYLGFCQQPLSEYMPTIDIPTIMSDKMQSWSKIQINIK